MCATAAPAFAASILAALADSKFAPSVVLTQPDRPKGRGRKPAPNAVKSLAEKLDLTILQPETLKDEGAQAELRSEIEARDNSTGQSAP